MPFKLKWSLILTVFRVSVNTSDNRGKDLWFSDKDHHTVETKLLSDEVEF